MNRDFRHQLKSALSLDLGYSIRFSLQEAKPSAVLVLWGQERSGESPSVLLTQRTETVKTHRGQIAFPGGMCDPEDLLAQGEYSTALRETREEVGIPESQIEILGKLPELWTPSGFKITPVVGWLLGRPSELKIEVNPSEIAEAFWVSRAQLESPGVYRTEAHRMGQISYPIHVYLLEKYRVWGATGAMLWNLLQRVSRADGG